MTLMMDHLVTIIKHYTLIDITFMLVTIQWWITDSSIIRFGIDNNILVFLLPHYNNEIRKVTDGLYKIIILANNQFFLFFCTYLVTYFELVLAPVVKTFFVSYLLMVASPCVFPAPFFPFFLYPFLCHFGSHL